MAYKANKWRLWGLGFYWAKSPSVGDPAAEANSILCIQILNKMFRFTF